MNATYVPIAEAQMLIKKPVSEVFNAFIDPEITKNFWFTNASGSLEVGTTITWEWEMYKVKTDVFVFDIKPNQLIALTWGTPATYLDFEFEAVSEQTTYVQIKNYGFTEVGNELIEVIKNNTGGFTTVLDGLKAYLEHGINLNLIHDKFLKK
ncbi:SRPBCC family protein [Flavobacterium agricola]|uniref:SRPBCC family protein n=1 Tax=Flavobacterium agricola TaxID=2870839 RepID=A0ABY6M0Y1_9FLAO|nr:SRPBCC family protein [Flavobacterium agricola]UYW02210.1 SRPBCC family protein [Flavobacterium agricola]